VWIKTTIWARLLGKDAQNVGYKFDVNFHTIGKKCQNNQRCTLLLWRSVRELDRYLKTYPTKKLQSGLVEVNNSMVLDRACVKMIKSLFQFVPGIKYILNVTLIGGTVVQERQLTLDYVDDSVRKNVTKPMASLFLLAPDTSYAYAAYVVSADVNICSNVSSFYVNPTNALEFCVIEIFSSSGSLWGKTRRGFRAEVRSWWYHLTLFAARWSTPSSAI
jgi:hypothetical protein